MPEEMDWFDAVQLAKKRHTPESGVNLCEIDDFEFPPHNLSCLHTFETAQMARLAAKEYPHSKLVIIFPDGHGEEP